MGKRNRLLFLIFMQALMGGKRKTQEDVSERYLPGKRGELNSRGK
jgi:hypothetical protein